MYFKFERPEGLQLESPDRVLLLSSESQSNGTLLLVARNNSEVVTWAFDPLAVERFYKQAKAALDGKRHIFTENSDEFDAQLQVQFALRGGVNLTLYFHDSLGTTEVELNIPLTEWNQLLSSLEGFCNPQLTIKDVELL